MKILGISGKAQHGKDTCARIARDIASEKGFLVGSWAFAHPLKAVVYAEGAGKFTYEDVFFHKPPAVRELLQRRGTEEGRDKYGPNFWILQTEIYIKLFAENFPLDLITLTDVRFPNEVEFTRKHGTSLWIHSDRPTLTGKAAEHPSETSLDNVDKTTFFDGIIDNSRNVTLLDLKEQLKPYVYKLLNI